MYTLQELAKYVEGHVVGDPNIEINGVQSFESASSRDLTLAAESGYYEQLEKTHAAAVVVPLDIHYADKSLLQGSGAAALSARQASKSSKHGSKDPSGLPGSVDEDGDSSDWEFMFGNINVY